jgi:hypothetical protein
MIALLRLTWTYWNARTYLAYVDHAARTQRFVSGKPSDTLRHTRAIDLRNKTERIYSKRAGWASICCKDPATAQDARVMIPVLDRGPG